MTKTRSNRPTSQRAFSLIELLIVILIIALITAIVLPALAHARKAARNSATRTLMVQVEQACSSFQLSERRLPGYFSEADMGSSGAGNATRGFTEMENVMFDLAGGVIKTDPSHPAWYGPVSTRLVAYDPDMVGSQANGNKLYFTPPAKNFKLQDGSDGGTKVADPNHIQYVKDLVDAEGTPILMWRTDPMSIQPIAASADFATDAPTPTATARFYWNANAAFLNSPMCGTKRVDENANSLIGGGNTANRLTSLVGVLGNPSSPVNMTPPAGNPILPSAGRGQFILQAAGNDATFVGKQERGGKLATGGTNLTYDLNFRSQPSSDIMADFDDILVAGG